MSDELRDAGIELHQGYDAKQLDIKPDLVVVGNVMKRGMPVIERMLNEHVPYVSGPQWLEEHYLKNKCVLAVAGTHGKTTTSSMLNWILEKCGKNPGFLIGGIPGNFGISARNTDSEYFVIEADEYDCAFFDKRSKFVHYHPQVLVINNIEYDHADIFASVKDIERQFHHLVRTIPSEGLIVASGNEPYVEEALNMGCWTKVIRTGALESEWSYELIQKDGSQFYIVHAGQKVTKVQFNATGEYNVKNALNACIAATYCGVTIEDAAQALSSFVLPKRRMELKGEAQGVKVYDDFAHHPTAVKVTLHGMREHLGKTQHMLAVFEPRSNSMKMGANHEALQYAFNDADETFIYAPEEIKWNVDELVSAKIKVMHNFDALVEEICAHSHPGTSVIVMSNGSFNGIHQKILDLLKSK